MPSGKYIVIEGIEAVGKTTVIDILARELQAARVPVQVMSGVQQSGDITTQAIQRIIEDPRYPMSNRADVLLYNAIRAQSLGAVQRAMAAGIVCIADHSFLATLVSEYYGRGDITDYAAASQIVQFATGPIQPDLLVLLDAPVGVVKERIDAARGVRLDEAYLERIRAGYLWEAKQRNLPVIYTTDPLQTVLASIWEHIRRVVSGSAQPKNDSSVQSVAEMLAARPVVRAVGARGPAVGTSAPRPQATPTPANTAQPAQGMVSDGPRTRQHSDGAVTITESDKSEQALRQAAVVDAGFAQQLPAQHIVVKDASQLLAQKLEQGELTALIEQPECSADFSQKDVDGQYSYYIPPKLKSEIRTQYIRTMDEIFDMYSRLVNDLASHIRTTSSAPAARQDAAWQAATKAQACNAVRPLLPVATKTTVGFYASDHALESLTERLLSNELAEARTVGQQILTQAREALPVTPERTAAVAYQSGSYQTVGQLAHDLLPATHTAENEAVTLVQYSPRSELNTIADILYEHTDLPLDQLRKMISRWPRQRKIDVLITYVGKRPNRGHRPVPALEKIHYSFDLVCDYNVFRNMQRSRMADDAEWQPLSPRLGYEVPTVIEAAGAADAFEHCFDLSLKLYAALQASGLALEAQYATLLGHKLRWKVTYNARQAFQLYELATSPQSHPGYRKLVQQMHARIAGAHPLLADAMRFVSQE